MAYTWDSEVWPNCEILVILRTVLRVPSNCCYTQFWVVEYGITLAIYFIVYFKVKLETWKYFYDSSTLPARTGAAVFYTMANQSHIALSQDPLKDYLQHFELDSHTLNHLHLLRLLYIHANEKQSYDLPLVPAWSSRAFSISIPRSGSLYFLQILLHLCWAQKSLIPSIPASPSPIDWVLLEKVS